MTEYWVSQGNKWCDFCKIYISNNPLTIRTHELGKRHKDNVAKKLVTMQKESAAKEKQVKQAAQALEQIEAKANRSYQKDLQNSQINGNSGAATIDGWEYDASTGYYLDRETGLHFDSNSGFYYSDHLGKWVTQDEAFKSVKNAKAGTGTSSSTLLAKPLAIKGGPAPGKVVSAAALNPMRTVKGAQSSIAVNKRKREEGKPKAISKEEDAALKAREAARKRVEEREKPMMGLYKSY